MLFRSGRAAQGAGRVGPDDHRWELRLRNRQVQRLRLRRNRAGDLAQGFRQPVGTYVQHAHAPRPRRRALLRRRVRRFEGIRVIPGRSSDRDAPFWALPGPCHAHRPQRRIRDLPQHASNTQRAAQPPHLFRGSCNDSRSCVPTAAGPHVLRPWHRPRTRPRRTSPRRGHHLPLEGIAQIEDALEAEARVIPECAELIRDVKGQRLTTGAKAVLPP